MPQRIFAIGDVHGCLRQLDAILDALAPLQSDRIIFVGDLIDRGPDSAGVIKRVLQLRKSHSIAVIRGNHEQMMCVSGYECVQGWVFDVPGNKFGSRVAGGCGREGYSSAFERF